MAGLAGVSPEAWRAEEAAIIRKALAAEKMMPDRWEVSRKIYLSLRKTLS